MTRPFCAEVSEESSEPLSGTASRVERWLVLEYRGLWNRQVLGGSTLSERVKGHLTEQLSARPRSRLLFVRRPERRRSTGLKCYFGQSLERDRRFSELDLESYEDLLAVDFARILDDGSAARLAHPLLVVCTHGKRDRCCARYGRPLYDELREQLDDDWVWQSTHVGGDRFAGNLVCLPEGLYFGRVGRAEVWTLLDEYLAGRLYLDRFRGRSCHPFAVQAADRAVRARTRLTGIDDLRLVSARRQAEGWRIALAADASGEVHEVDIVAELGDLTYLTCSSPTLQRPRRFVTAKHRVRPAG
ncbi:MAG: hypothetical protein H0U03_04025 [Actinobacteria bacterium]|nr:hypothetical protein [Actinomycetota bacterium]